MKGEEGRVIDMENSFWLRGEWIVCIYIQLKNRIPKGKGGTEGDICAVCSLSDMIDRWHSSRQKCGEC